MKVTWKDKALVLPNSKARLLGHYPDQGINLPRRAYQ